MMLRACCLARSLLCGTRGWHAGAAMTTSAPVPGVWRYRWTTCWWPELRTLSAVPALRCCTRSSGAWMPSEFLLFTARQAQTLAESRALVQGLAHLLATSVRVGRDPALLLFWLGLPDLLWTRCALLDCKAIDLID